MESGAAISLLHGALTTLWLSALGIALGIPLGLLIALIRVWRTPVLSQLLSAYVSLGRATPLVTLSLLVFFGLPSLGITLNATLAALVALTLNTAPFHSEIWRAALISFPKDQMDAARAAGMTAGLAFRRIILPQAWRVSLPGIVNEMTFMIKGSPAVAVIGVVDLTRAAVRVSSYTYEPLPPFLTATIIYVVVIAILVRIQRMIERWVLNKYGTA